MMSERRAGLWLTPAAPSRRLAWRHAKFSGEGMAKTPTKEERLAAALRDNLRRRKAQSRETPVAGDKESPRDAE